MKKGFGGIATLAVVILLAILALKILGAVIGLALKVVLLVALVGAGIVAYLAVQKRLGDWRAP